MKKNRKDLIAISIVVAAILIIFLSIGFFVSELLGILFVLAPLYSIPVIVVAGSIYYIVLGICKIQKGQNTKKGILLIAVGIVFLLFVVFLVLSAFDILKSGTLSV